MKLITHRKRLLTFTVGHGVFEPSGLARLTLRSFGTETLGSDFLNP